MILFFDSECENIKFYEISLIKKISRDPRPQLLTIKDKKVERNTIYITDNRIERRYFNDFAVEIVINTEQIKRKLYCCRYPEEVHMIEGMLIMMNSGDEQQTHIDNTEGVDCSWIVIVNLNTNTAHILGINDVYCDDGTKLSKTMEFLDPETYIDEMPSCSYLLSISDTRGQSLKDVVLHYNAQYDDINTKLESTSEDLDHYVAYFNEFFRIVYYDLSYCVYINDDLIYKGTEFIMSGIVYSDSEYIVSKICDDYNTILFINYTGQIVYRLDGMNVRNVVRSGRRFYCELMPKYEMEKLDITEYMYIDL